jgi:hypothetical protein
MARVNAIGTGFEEGDIDDIVCVHSIGRVKGADPSSELEISKR